MSCSWFPGSFAAFGLLLGSAALAATEPAPHVPVPGLEEPVWVIDPPAIFLTPRKTGPFLEERAAMMETLLRPGLDEQTRLRTLISLAELHFGHGLMTEGLSILAEVQGPEVPPAHKLRAAALELALGVFDPLQRPLTDRAQELLQPAHGKWPDQPLMLTLSELRAGDCAEAAPSLRHSFERLQRFPLAAREHVLPLLLECAIDERQWRVARDIAASFAEHPGLHDGPALHFLLGKVAEFGQEPLAAFDSYALAQGSDGLWGHRARRALVDLGLRHEALSSAEAAELLASEVELWRGDDFAASTLSDLAALQEMAGDAPAAVESLGRLMQRHAGAPEAVVALTEARRLIDALYEQGAAGEISLSGFMVLHARIAPWFRFTQGYAQASERFADTFLAAGATMIAAREYASIRGHLIAAQDLGLHDPVPGQLQRLAVKEAEAMLGGGQFDALGMFLAEPPKIDDPDLAHRLALVSARYLAETGQRAALLSQPAPEAPEQVLRLRAQAHFEREDWPAAQSAYADLARRIGADLPLPDAIRYLLAAHRSGDRGTAAQLVARFETLADLPQWTEIAATLTTPTPELLPLREEAARQRIDSAKDMLETLSGAKSVN